MPWCRSVSLITSDPESNLQLIGTFQTSNEPQSTHYLQLPNCSLRQLSHGQPGINWGWWVATKWIQNSQMLQIWRPAQLRANKHRNRRRNCFYILQTQRKPTEKSNIQPRKLRYQEENIKRQPGNPKSPRFVSIGSCQQARHTYREGIDLFFIERVGIVATHEGENRTGTDLRITVNGKELMFRR